ncbi:MAG TPA: hypothetical protein VG013_26875 [Gemmataceae bacterium]|jgi:hypothetical protein|nr:hypothetical protein [Gemmataceae bacterium]
MDAADDRPWEQPGCVRRDCQPHRAALLLFLGRVTLGCGILSFVLLFPSLVGLALSIAVGVMARKDLHAIHAGSMDPEGLVQTLIARELAVVGAVLCILGCMCFGVISLFVHAVPVFL